MLINQSIHLIISKIADTHSVRPERETVMEIQVKQVQLQLLRGILRGDTIGRENPLIDAFHIL